MTKTYKVRIDDQDLIRVIDHEASVDGRAAGDFLAAVLRQWAFGVLRDLGEPTPGERQKYLPVRASTRVSLKASERAAIFSRDNGHCRHCGGAIPFQGDWHIDHLLPVSKGGSSEAANLALSCSKCNLQKKDKLLAAMVGAK